MIASTFTKDEPRYRDVLPEPIDYFDHVGNANYSTGLGMVVAAGAVVANAARGEERVGVVRRRAVTAAFVAGAILNTIGETKLGAPIFGSSMENGVTDFTYGVVAATGAAAATIAPGTRQQVEAAPQPEAFDAALGPMLVPPDASARVDSV